MIRIRGRNRGLIRDQINETGWWSSSEPTRDDIDPRWFWDDNMENLSVASYRGCLHVLSVHCLETINQRGQKTVHVVLECEEGVYYRDSCGLVSQIQKTLDWFGPVEKWPPVRIGRPSETYPRYTIVPQF